MGAVRVGRIDGEFVVNPTHEQNFEESALDLIVVGTKDGLTMIEAGASEVSEDILLDAFELAHRGDPQALRGAGGSAPPGRQGEVARSGRVPPSSRARTGHAVWERIQQVGAPRGRPIVEAVAELARSSRWSRGDEDIQRQLQTRSSLAMILEKARLAAVEGPVREQFETDLRALTDAEEDSKELKSAKRHLLFDRIVETVELPFSVGPATVEGEGPPSRTR